MTKMKSRWHVYGAIIGIVCAFTFGSWYLFNFYQPYDRILDFNDIRDTKDILDIFKRDFYWLTANENFSAEFMLKYRTPTQDFQNIGRLHIKVMRSKEGFIGFVAYYMKTSIGGMILFLDVNPPFRGKGYSEKLMRYALNNLKRLGAKVVQLVTRTNNIHAQNLYNRLNFTETSRTNSFVYFAKKLD